MRLGIFGNGVTGGTLRRWLQKNTTHEIVIYDPPQGFDKIQGAMDAAFISVPVPTKGMKQDLSILHDAIKHCVDAKHVFIRSTVLPGTCDKLSSRYGRAIHAMPEFLTERTCDEDFDEQAVLVGGNTDPYYDLKERIFDNKKDIRWATNQVCEMAKFTHNCFGAIKVTYFNAINDLCKQSGINYEEVRRLTLLSGYINDVHTLVPGPDGQRGYGGKCFPDNMSAFTGWIGDNPAHLLFRDVMCLNRFYRGEKDLPSWERDSKEAI